MTFDTRYRSGSVYAVRPPVVLNVIEGHLAKFGIFGKNYHFRHLHLRRYLSLRGECPQIKQNRGDPKPCEYCENYYYKFISHDIPPT
jgi:hypothetical protein